MKIGVGALVWLLSMSAYAFCFEEAGARFDVNPTLLKAIAYTESGLDQRAINNRNSNGTTDYGLMQINSWWFDKLADFGVSSESVINDGCTNVHVRAWILATNLAQSGENWLAVGAYNAGYAANREEARQRYIETVQTNFKELERR